MWRWIWINMKLRWVAEPEGEKALGFVERVQTEAGKR